MSSAQCLNCGHPLHGKFCNHCGQKASTHRLSIGHFLAHDFLHGVFHMDKGILFTLKQIFFHPGVAAREYIQGKRAAYFNFFTLLVLVLGLNIGVGHFTDSAETVSVEEGRELVSLVSAHAQLTILTLLPVLAVLSYLFFSRLKFNFTEHLVPAVFVVITAIVCDLLSGLIDWMIGGNFFDTYVNVFAMMAYGIFIYRQFCRPQYAGWAFIWRIFLIMICFYLFIAVFFWILHFLNAHFHLLQPH